MKNSRYLEFKNLYYLNHVPMNLITVMMNIQCACGIELVESINSCYLNHASMNLIMLQRIFNVSVALICYDVLCFIIISLVVSGER